MFAIRVRRMFGYEPAFPWRHAIVRSADPNA